MKNIILFGSYSGNNKGDVAIALAITRSLLTNIYISKIYIPSKYPSLLSSYINNKKINIFHTLTSYWGVSTLKYLIKSDLIVIGGGGLFFSAKLFNPFFNHLINIFFIAIFNKLFLNKPLIIFAIGISNLDSTLSRFFAAFVFKHSTSIVVRDEHSYRIAKTLTDNKIIIFRDPAFTLKSSIAKKNTYKRPRIIFCLNDSLISKHSNDVYKLITSLSTNFEVFLFENTYFSGKLETFAKSFPSNNYKILIKPKLSPEEVVSLIKDFDLSISAPMHFSIFSFLAGTTTYLIAYNQKVVELAKILKTNNLFYPENMSAISKKIESHKFYNRVKVPFNVIDSARSGLAYLNHFIDELDYPN